jgi:hypothetical protein
LIARDTTEAIDPLASTSASSAPAASTTTPDDESLAVCAPGSSARMLTSESALSFLVFRSSGWGWTFAWCSCLARGFVARLGPWAGAAGCGAGAPACARVGGSDWVGGVGWVGARGGCTASGAGSGDTAGAWGAASGCGSALAAEAADAASTTKASQMASSFTLLDLPGLARRT